MAKKRPRREILKTFNQVTLYAYVSGKKKKEGLKPTLFSRN